MASREVRCEIKRESSGLFSLTVWSITASKGGLPTKMQVPDGSRFWNIEDAKAHARQAYGVTDREISVARTR